MLLCPTIIRASIQKVCRQYKVSTPVGAMPIQNNSETFLTECFAVGVAILHLRQRWQYSDEKDICLHDRHGCNSAVYGELDRQTASTYMSIRRNTYVKGRIVNNDTPALGLTQEELGVKLGVTNQAVSKWESEISHS